MRLGLLAICAVLAIAGAAQAQSTQQSQALLNCYLNCDSRAGLCQGVCSQSNSPAVTLAPNAAGVRPDPGALSQCFINCSTQQLTCKQSCAIR